MEWNKGGLLQARPGGATPNGRRAPGEGGWWAQAAAGPQAPASDSSAGAPGGVAAGPDALADGHGRRGADPRDARHRLLLLLLSRRRARVVGRLWRRDGRGERGGELAPLRLRRAAAEGLLAARLALEPLVAEARGVRRRSVLAA